MKNIVISAFAFAAMSASGAHAKASLATLLCPQNQMEMMDYLQLGQPMMPRATPLPAAAATRLNTLFEAALKSCGKQSGWSKGQMAMARKFAISDAAYETMGMRFAARGARSGDVVLNMSKLTDAQKKSITDGTMEKSGTLDVVIAELKTRKIRMDYNDADTRKDIEALFVIAATRFGILGKFTDG
jgi:hypothetical protein